MAEQTVEYSTPRMLELMRAFNQLGDMANQAAFAGQSAYHSQLVGQQRGIQENIATERRRIEAEHDNYPTD